MTIRCPVFALVYIFIFLAGSNVAFAQTGGVDAVIDIKSANRRMEESHMAFQRGDTRDAMNGYVQVAQAGFATPSVWTNAGTAAYRSGDIGRAVLYYKRALRLDPGYERAQRSLDVVSPATNDSGVGFGTQFVDSIFRITSPGFWAIAGEVFYLLALFAIARIFAVSDHDRRVYWTVVAVWCAVLLVVAAGAAFGSHRFRVGGNDAVVLQDKTITRSEPSEAAKAQLELPAGTIVQLTERPQRGFVRFKLADGRAGFLPIGAIEGI